MLDHYDWWLRNDLQQLFQMIDSDSSGTIEASESFGRRHNLSRIFSWIVRRRICFSGCTGSKHWKKEIHYIWTTAAATLSWSSIEYVCHFLICLAWFSLDAVDMVWHDHLLNLLPHYSLMTLIDGGVWAGGGSSLRWYTLLDLTTTTLMRCGLLRMIVMRNITESLYISVVVYESITSVCNILYTQKQLMNMWIIDFC